MTTPLILIWMGAPAVKNMSDACFSAISLKSGVTNMVAYLLSVGCAAPMPTRGGVPVHRMPPRPCERPAILPTPGARGKCKCNSGIGRPSAALVAPQQLVDAGLGARPRVHLLHDHGAVEAALAVVG